MAPTSISPIQYASVGAGAVDVRGNLTGNVVTNTSTGAVNVVGSTVGCNVCKFS